MIESYYKILGVDKNDSLADVRKAFRAKAKIWHPDVNKHPEAHEKFILVNEAYEYLQNRKTGKIYNKKTKKYSRRDSSQYHTYEGWRKAEREKARARANHYARMRYREFTKTDYYKTSEALNIIFDHLSFVLALSIIIGFPLTGALIEGFTGFFVGLGIIILTFGIRADTLLRNKHKIEFKKLFRSISLVAKSKSFHLVVISIFNLVIFFRIVINTLFPTWIVLVTIASIIIIGILILKFYTAAGMKHWIRMIFFGLLPGIFSLLFLLNFLISSKSVTETYFFEFGAQRSYIGTEETTYITLENNVYDKYVGIRVFINYEEMIDAVTISYTFEEGLLGLRVMKDYKFNEMDKFFNVQ